MMVVFDMFLNRLTLENLMKQAITKGISFGLTSGIITTLGLIVGLSSGTHSRIIVLGGIFTIAVADALSDSLGVHISEEADNTKNEKQIWAATLSTLISKFLFALTFAVPFLLCEDLLTPILISIVWGFFWLIILSIYVAKQQKSNPFLVILEHLTIVVVVIIITYYVGVLVESFYCLKG